MWGGAVKSRPDYFFFPPQGLQGLHGLQGLAAAGMAVLLVKRTASY